jgi:hypothetical protein
MGFRGQDSEFSEMRNLKSVLGVRRDQVSDGRYHTEEWQMTNVE